MYVPVRFVFGFVSYLLIMISGGQADFQSGIPAESGMPAQVQPVPAAPATQRQSDPHHGQGGQGNDAMLRLIENQQQQVQQMHQELSETKMKLQQEQNDHRATDKKLIETTEELRRTKQELQEAYGRFQQFEEELRKETKLKIQAEQMANERQIKIDSMQVRLNEAIGQLNTAKVRSAQSASFHRRSHGGRFGGMGGAGGMSHGHTWYVMSLQ